MKRFLLIALLLSTPLCWAGPPYITDDPEPMNYHQYQFFIFANGVQTPQGTGLNVPALEFDYGVIPHLEIGLTIPLTINLPKDPEGASAAGLGDIQAAAKYRFFDETPTHPEVAFAPAYIFPSGNYDRGLSNGRSWTLLPIWLQKTWKKWIVYGGGGIAMNSAASMRNALFGGCVVQHDVTDQWQLGAELFAQGATSTITQSFTLLNIGSIYHINEGWSFLLSAGKNIRGENNLVTYIGFNWQSKTT
ncbi:MAG: transporter [Gammaproteobacteria bacterium]|nr:transporter [Gammaproteobacteria bacterium]